MASPLVLFLCFVSIHSVAIADLSSEFAHHAVLDPAEKMKLYWTVDWDAKMVYFAVEAATTGWVGFGFSGRSGAMIGSDVVIGWVKNNEGYLRDRFADEEKLPPVDEQQDYKLIGFEESGGKTVLKFKREFDTCDSRDRKLEAGATKVVFAYHDDDPASESKIKYHTFRGSRTLMLLNSMDKRNINETGWLSFPITTKNVTIPAKETTYWCALIKAPELQSKHHITKVEPLVQKGNEGFVHHLILYECEGNFTENDYDQGRDCMDTANMPYARCREASIVVAWAVGGESFYYPLHAGFPLGADDSPKNFLLEMHYDNPSNVPGRVDSSGVRIYYTDKLRKYDSGIVSVGVKVNNWHIIPPKQKDWLSIGYCTAECTESIFNSTSLQGGGINVFASILHTHLAGRAIWTRHIRNGKELPEIARDDHYDFNFQDTQVLRKEINIQPGDEMIHYCKYNSMDRDQLTKGGIASREEMCLDFLFYYPRVPKIKLCQSTAYGPPYKFIKKYLKDASLTSLYRNPMTKTSLDWTDEMVADFREYNEEVQRVFPRCGIRKFSSAADTMNPNFTVPIPKIVEPLPTEKSDCPPIPVAAGQRMSPGVFAVYFGILRAVFCIVNQ